MSITLESMEITLDYKFAYKPLLVGGGAMEYYGLRPRGADIDFILHEKDYNALAAKYPENKKDIYGDLGVVKDGYEVWRTIMMQGYEHMKQEAVEYNGYLVSSLERLLFLKALGISEPKYEADVRLIVKKIIQNIYKE